MDDRPITLLEFLRKLYYFTSPDSVRTANFVCQGLVYPLIDSQQIGKPEEQATSYINVFKTNKKKAFNRWGYLLSRYRINKANKLEDLEKIWADVFRDKLHRGLRIDLAFFIIEVPGVGKVTINHFYGCCGVANLANVDSISGDFKRNFNNMAYLAARIAGKPILSMVLLENEHNKVMSFAKDHRLLVTDSRPIENPNSDNDLYSVMLDVRPLKWVD